MHHVLHDGDDVRQLESHFLDLVVTDRPLRLMAGEAADDLVSQLNRPWRDAVGDGVDRLVGRRADPDLAAGRVALLVCVVDGDLSCGQLTAALGVGDATVSWSDLQWETGYGVPVPVQGLPAPIVFHRGRYEATLADAHDRVAELPHDEPAHRGRRFLWPWQWGWRLPQR